MACRLDSHSSVVGGRVNMFGGEVQHFGLAVRCGDVGGSGRSSRQLDCAMAATGGHRPIEVVGGNVPVPGFDVDAAADPMQFDCAMVGFGNHLTGDICKVETTVPAGKVDIAGQAADIDAAMAGGTGDVDTVGHVHGVV